MPAEIPVDAPVSLKDLSGHTPMMAQYRCDIGFMRLTA